MCGIIGYIGKKDALPIIVEGLKRLEYRGYDSAGVVVFDKDNNAQAVKAKGKIKDLKDKGLWIDEEQTQIFYKMKGGIKNMEETEKTDVEAPVEEVAEEVVEEAKEEEVEEEATAEAETEADQI